ncbi:MAG: response regulator [Bacteroidetes bacterium]|nr:response regulator [Bacteroidota bacterium]
MKDKNQCRILFIDDEKASQTAFKSVFRDYYEIYLASSAEEGYEVMKKNNIDIVISDQRMPGVTGVEFLHKIRVEFPDTVRMLVTGYSDIDAVVQSINGSQISYYFAKPYDANDMKSILDNTIEKIKLLRENHSLLEKLQSLIMELTDQKGILEQEIVTRKAMEEELIIEHQKAEESSRLKSSLLANMSHEFRTPMNSILGFSQILKDSMQDEEFKNLAGMINISGKRLLKTLNSIVDLSRLEADKKPPNIEVINLSELARKIVKDFREPAEKKRLVISENIHPEVCITFNNSFASMIITNLIDNAIKFTPKGSVHVMLHQEESTGNAVFKVRDTGIGIPTEFHNRIFEEFRQVSEGMGRFYEGLGIGLSLSKKILTRLKGEITVESETGKGTTFTVKFPVSGLAAVPAVAGIKIKEVPVIPTEPDSKPVREKLLSVLVVEDNQYNQELMEMFLKPSFIIDQAFDGETAVRKTMEKLFDVILMDINLGAGMDGILAIKKIMEKKENVRIPVIAMTGYTNLDDKERFLSSGFSGFLPKPFTKQSLWEIIRTVTGN